MTITTIRFNEVTMRRKIHIHCPECGKKRYKTISRSYFRNGFHNESETRDKYNKELDNETARLQLKGIICSPCEKKGKPVELTIRDIHPGDELVTYNKVYAVKEINTTGRNPRKLILQVSLSATLRIIHTENYETTIRLQRWAKKSSNFGIPAYITMEVRPNRTSNYRFTVRMDNEADMQAVAALKAQIADQNKRGEARGYYGEPAQLRVKLQFRRPELNHPYAPKHKYGWGGSVRKDQKPKEADVYVYVRERYNRPEPRPAVCPLCGK